MLKNEFEMKDSGESTIFLGMQMKREKSPFINQNSRENFRYIKYEKLKLKNSPMETSQVHKRKIKNPPEHFENNHTEKL